MASSHLPNTKLSGLKICPKGPDLTESMVPGSRSTRIARGTYLPPPQERELKLVEEKERGREGKKTYQLNNGGKPQSRTSRWLHSVKSSVRDMRKIICFKLSMLNHVKRAADLWPRYSRRWSCPAAGHCLHGKFLWDQCRARRWSLPRTADNQTEGITWQSLRETK